LGLPSCRLFCLAANGDISLFSTRLQDDKGNNGYTQFNFSVAGKIIRIDTKVSEERDVSNNNNFRLNTQSSSSIFDIEIRRSSSELKMKLRQESAKSKIEESSQILETSTNINDPLPITTNNNNIPDICTIVVIDDSALNRSCLIRRIQKVQKELGANQWEYKNFENFEDAMPALRKIHQGKQQCIVTIDEQMASSGGVMTGLNGTCWLINDLKFQGDNYFFIGRCRYR